MTLFCKRNDISNLASGAKIEPGSKSNFLHSGKGFNHYVKMMRAFGVAILIKCFTYEYYEFFL